MQPRHGFGGTATHQAEPHQVELSTAWKLVHADLIAPLLEGGSERRVMEVNASGRSKQQQKRHLGDAAAALVPGRRTVLPQEVDG